MKIELARTETIHFVGIGGIGMSGLANIMKGLGFKVQGSDINSNKNIERLKKIQEQIHDNFISYVKLRRGNKLNENNLEEIFSGLFWVGQKGIDLGLADGLGSINEIIENKFGKKAKIKIIDQKKSFLQRRLPSSLIDSDAVLQKIEEKALWSKYGL